MHEPASLTSSFSLFLQFVASKRNIFNLPVCSFANDRPGSKDCSILNTLFPFDKQGLLDRSHLVSHWVQVDQPQKEITG